MGEPLRILLVEGSGRGFLSHYVHALAWGLSEAGQAVLLATGREDELAGWPVPFDKAPVMRRNAADWLRLTGAVLRFRPDVVHFQWMNDPFLGAVFAAWLRRRGIAVAYTPHNLLPHCGRWISMPVFGRLYRSMDRVVARDAHMAWGAEEMLGVPPDRLALMPGSPNLLAHPAAPRRVPAELARRRAGETRILFFGHGCPRKGLYELLEATAALTSVTGLHVVIAGNGVARHLRSDRLERAVRAAQITVVDRYVAPDEVAGLFSDADALVMPYIKRCSSPILDLAAAFRLPVLRSDRVEGPQFREGVHGLTLPSGSAEALRDALAGLVAEPARLRQLRAALGREESVAASIRRLSDSHARMYGDARAAGKTPRATGASSAGVSARPISPAG